MSAFCTADDIAAFLQITIPEYSESVTRAIEEASAAIQNYTRQALEAVSDDEITLDCIGGTKLFLPELPVTAINEVTEDGEVLVVDDDYVLGQYGILHRIGAKWATGIQIIVVDYDHGYATIPDDLRSVCTRAAARTYQAGQKAAALAGVPGVQSTSLGDYSVTYGTDQPNAALVGPYLLPSEKALLDRYRIDRP